MCIHDCKNKISYANPTTLLTLSLALTSNAMTRVCPRISQSFKKQQNFTKKKSMENLPIKILYVNEMLVTIKIPYERVLGLLSHFENRY